MNNSVSNTTRLLTAGLRALLALTLLTGVLYPLAVTGIAQGLFPHQANGSHIEADGEVVGSELIGQTYTLPPKEGQEAPAPDLRWFQPRPSHGLGTNTVNTQYDLLLSGATNLSAGNKTLTDQVKTAKQTVIGNNTLPGHTVRPQDIPAGAVTSSASGLDPHISPAYARLQTHRVAHLNSLDVEEVKELVEKHIEGRVAGFLGEPHVNVLKLNIELRELTENSR